MKNYYGNEEKIGPLIGILTARKINGSVAGNGALFKKLQKKLISINGLSFIFTLDGVGEDFITGYTFLPEMNSWIKINTPFPNLVYNRIPFRKSEKDESFHRFLTTLKEKKIPFFNPCFIDKYELFCLFKNHPILKSHLPKTILANQEHLLLSFLRTHKSLYLKPAQSSKGKGIFKLKLDTQMHILLEGLNRSDAFPSFHHFWLEWEKNLIDNHYIAQEEIKSSLFEGKRFDFRILAHAEKDGYIVTGIGVRQSQEQEITTHIPTGGRLLPYQRIQTPAHDLFIETVVHHIGETLTNELGFFGEFSIDAGISQSGYYYLYEVNSKPMSFDETEIEERKIAQLCRLFLQKTGFEN